MEIVGILLKLPCNEMEYRKQNGIFHGNRVFPLENYSLFIRKLFADSNSRSIINRKLSLSRVVLHEACSFQPWMH